jgi:hypothetical protein
MVLDDAGMPVPSRRLAVRRLAVGRQGDRGCGEAPQIEATCLSPTIAARSAQRLETYLRRNTKDVTGSASGQGLSHVEAAGSKLKVWTLLNGDVATDDACG